MKTHVVMLAGLLGLVTVLVVLPQGCARSDSGSAAVKKAKYHCPMHPTVVSDKPDDCPICGMKLVPIEAPTSTPSDLPGLAVVNLGPDVRKKMGLTLGTVGKRALVRTIRTSARVVADETRLFRVTTKTDGWVDRLLVATPGQAVRQGDPLLTLYSPQLVSAQQEYLSVFQSVAGDAAGGAGRLLESARQRLKSWDMGDEAIARLEKTRQVERAVTIYAPAGGVVAAKGVVAGQKITAGDSLMVLSDVSVVWGDADIYASDLPYVRTGMPMELTFPYWPGKTFNGNVSFLSPTLDQETRTLGIRIEIPNPELILKPGMFGDARLGYSVGERLVVPEAAIMRTGERSYVFRDSGDGKLTPVDIKVGLLSDGYCEVLAGLNEGDSVVTSANFLVDSESSMRAALELLSGKSP